jgi:hypothetical protein
VVKGVKHSDTFKLVCTLQALDGQLPDCIRFAHSANSSSSSRDDGLQGRLRTVWRNWLNCHKTSQALAAERWVDFNWAFQLEIERLLLIVRLVSQPIQHLKQIGTVCRLAIVLPLLIPVGCAAAA